MIMKNQKIIYLDYAATTPVMPSVLAAMEPYFENKFGNPGSIHRKGQEAMKALDDAREAVKDFLGASFLREIVFTGSATEANNLAIFGTLGLARAFRIRQPAEKESPRLQVITTAIEHESILEPCGVLEKDGIAEVTYLKPNAEGLISAKQIAETLRPETILVSIGYANNEIGVIQPISEIAKVIKDFKKTNQKSDFRYPLFQVDAAQATQFLDMNVERLGVDLMTLSAHKIYGPKGVGALYVRDGIKLRPILYGGGQEYSLRSSTQNLPYIVGLAKALEVLREWQTEGGPKKILELRDYLLDNVSEKIPNAVLNGSLEKRLPNNINICFGAKTDGEAMLIALSEQGICVSSGAACSARSQKPSHVIQALGKSAKESSASLRITLGRMTTKEEVDHFLAILVDIVQKFR